MRYLLRISLCQRHLEEKAGVQDGLQQRQGQTPWKTPNAHLTGDFWHRLEQVG